MKDSPKGEYNDGLANKYLKVKTVSTMLGLASIFYGIVAPSMGSLDFRKWPEIHKQRKVQWVLEEKQNVGDLFERLDLDRDSTLTFEEFYKGKDSYLTNPP